MDERSEATVPDSHYKVMRGNLYSLQKPHQNTVEYPRKVLPPSERSRVITRAREEVGHMATIKTLRHVQESYVWAGMIKDIDDCLKKCPICVTHTLRIIHLPMGGMPLASAPVQVVGADLIGPFVRSPEGNTYIPTTIDHCTY